MGRINTVRHLAVAIALVVMGNGFAAHHGTKAEEHQPSETGGLSIEDFQRAKVAIGKRVESGHITKEQAKARLLEMRRMIGGERKGEEHQSVGSRDLSIEDFQRAKVAIGKRVESGHITKERAETRLREMRRMISNGKSEGAAS